MSFQELASIDLHALTKIQLRSYTKLAREEWGRSIDLRSSSIHDLREYLTMYLSWKATAEAETTEPEAEIVAPEPEVTLTENAEVEIVTHTLSDLPEPTDPSEDEAMIVAEVEDVAEEPEPMTEAETDVTTWITLLYAGTPELHEGRIADTNFITWLFPAFSGDWESLREQIAFRVQPDSDELVEGEFYGVERLDHKDLFAHILPNLAWLRQVEDDEVFVFRQISEFEGIDDISMGDWWVSSPLTCDAFNYQVCNLPKSQKVYSQDFCGADRESIPHDCGKPETAIIGLVLLTAIALAADQIATTATWAFNRVRDTQLLQKGYKAAATFVQPHRPRPQGFARA
ncbi:hypothetical protein [Tolypothrix sp. VBCCA 56010]|uniref:hypothetical protein n=1 Tax=Tolypothrix sp. VBCCA 56010 TaxID=3137731 RepID=UPI003D7CC738